VSFFTRSHSKKFFVKQAVLDVGLGTLCMFLT